MRKITCILFIILTLSLVGCGKEPEPIPEPEPPVTYLHDQADSVAWNNLVISAITPCCAFDSTATKLTVYPYFDSNLCVTVETLLLSENEFWKAITKDLEKENISTSEGYSLATLPNGISIGMVPIDEENCYWVSSSDLPSGYVEAVLKALCR